MENYLHVKTIRQTLQFTWLHWLYTIHRDLSRPLTTLSNHLELSQPRVQSHKFGTLPRPWQHCLALPPWHSPLAMDALLNGRCTPAINLNPSGQDRKSSVAHSRFPWHRVSSRPACHAPPPSPPRPHASGNASSARLRLRALGEGN